MLQDRLDQLAELLGGVAAAGEHVGVVEGFFGDPGGGVRDHRDAAAAHAHVVGGDHLEHGRHADGVGAQAGEHLHLGGGFVGGAGQAGVDPFLELDAELDGAARTISRRRLRS